MKNTTILAALLASAAAHGAAIEQVIVRQQWPWSTDVKIEYRLSGVTSPVDISVKAYNGTTPLEISNISSALRGTRYGITESGVGTLVLDPVKAFGGQKVAIADFRVELELSDSAANLDEVLYKIVDLTKLNQGAAGCITDVTRREILNGEYGSYETDFGRIGPGFNTQLDDVIIWTGVTNDVAYKKEKLVLRKIPAAGKSFKMGIPGSTDANQVCVDVSFEHDFWMGVFETTAYQRTYLIKTYIDASRTVQQNETNELYSAELRAANMNSWHVIRSSNSGTDWPQNGHSAVYSWTPLGRMYAKTGLYFDLPTEAEWEFAARAGTTNALYSGKNFSVDNYKEIGRGWGINCKTAANEPGADPNDSNVQAGFPSRNCTLEYGCNIVGSYRPNAYGLYDTMGNALEWCLDRWDVNDLPTGGTDPRGATAYSNTSMPQRVIRGGSYRYQFNDVGYRAPGTMSYNTRDFGFRICLHEVD